MKQILNGDVFGRLYVVGLHSEKSKCRQKKYVCKCSCGKTRIVTGTALRNGTKSCGCLRIELFVERNKTHEMTNSALYHKWDSMIQRCTNIKNAKYNTYGGKGISVCNEWLNSFEEFYKWAITAGWRDGLVIDRIDTKSGYSPDNCHFVTIAQNNRNLLTSKLWSVRGHIYDSLSHAGEHEGVSKATIKRWCDGYITTSGIQSKNKENCFSINKY